MKVLLSKATAKLRNGHDTPTRTRIWIAIDAIPNGDIKVMPGHDDFFRLKGGKYRVFDANVNHDGRDVVAVHDIGARGETSFLFHEGIGSRLFCQMDRAVEEDQTMQWCLQWYPYVSYCRLIRLKKQVK